MRRTTSTPPPRQPQRFSTPRPHRNQRPRPAPVKPRSHPAAGSLIHLLVRRCRVTPWVAHPIAWFAASEPVEFCAGKLEQRRNLLGLDGKRRRDHLVLRACVAQAQGEAEGERQALDLFGAVHQCTVSGPGPAHVSNAVLHSHNGANAVVAVGKCSSGYGRPVPPATSTL